MKPQFLLAAMLVLAPMAACADQSAAPVVATPAIRPTVKAVSPAPATSGFSFQKIGRLFQDYFVKSRWMTALRNATSNFVQAFSPHGPPAPSKASGELVAKTAMKTQAIRFLSTLDNRSYPEILDALLVSLDDESEEVRFEAIKALNARRESGLFAECNAATKPCSCAQCLRHKKVVDRVNHVLLEQDDSGKLRETSPKVRDVAVALIEGLLAPPTSPSANASSAVVNANVPAEPAGTPTLDPAMTAKTNVSMPVPATGAPKKMSWQVRWFAKTDEPLSPTAQQSTSSYRGVEPTEAPTLKTPEATLPVPGPMDPPIAAPKTRFGADAAKSTAKEDESASKKGFFSGWRSGK